MQLTAHILRDTSRFISKSLRHRGCGIVRVGPDVHLAESSGRSKVRNVMTCGLRHVCANCATAGLAARGQQIQADLAVWFDSGRAVISVTLTVPHTSRDRYSKLVRWLDAGTEAMVRKGRPARRTKAQFRIVAVDRTSEDPWSDEGGWHPHVHLLLYIDGPLSDARLDELRDDLTRTYLAALRRESGLTSRLTEWAAEKVAVNVRRVTSARATATYLTKSPVENGQATGQFAVLAALHEHRQRCAKELNCTTCRRLVATWREYVEHTRDRPRFNAPRNFATVLEERGLVQPKVQPNAPTEREICVVKGSAWDLAARYQSTGALRDASVDGGLQAVRLVVAQLLVADGATGLDASVRSRMMVRRPGPSRGSLLRERVHSLGSRTLRRGRAAGSWRSVQTAVALLGSAFRRMASD